MLCSFFRTNVYRPNEHLNIEIICVSNRQRTDHQHCNYQILARGICGRVYGFAKE